MNVRVIVMDPEMEVVMAMLAVNEIFSVEVDIVLTLLEVFFEWNGGPSQAAGHIVNVEGQNALTPTVTEIYLFGKHIRLIISILS